MSIDIEQMINIDNDGNFKFGISKTLDNYTLDEIWENCYCGANMPIAKGIYDGENASSWWYVGQDRPLTVNSIIPNIRYIDCSAGNPERDEYSEDGYYVKTLLLYTSSYNTYVTTSTLSNFSMVLQLDMTRALLHFARSTGRSTGEVSPVWGDNKSYAPSRAMYFNKGSDWDENIDLQTSGEIIKIWAFQMIKYKDKYFILDMFNTRYPALLREPFASVGVVSCGFYSVDGTLGISIGQVTGGGGIEYNQSSASGLITCIDTNYQMYWQARTSTPVDYIEHTWYPKVQEIFQDNIKCYGCYFQTDKIYKPIIDGNNYVTGWTDVLTTPSAIDSWTGDTKHVVPDVKPSPTPSGDDMESMTTGFASTLSGCTTYYLMSPLDIVTLIRDYYQCANPGSTMSNSIISCNLLGINETEIFSESSLDSHTIKIPTVSGSAIFESTNSYDEIVGYLNKIPVGHIDVPRMNNDFHDFSPYTIYEVFIPYCGWCSLPDTVAGRTIWVELHIDLRTMCGKGIVMVGDDNGGNATCAEMCMNFGSSVPFAVIESGLQRQAAITAGIQTAGGFAQGMSGIISGHSSLAISGIVNAIQGVANGAISSCTNYTQVQGKAGDTSDFANGRRCYLKVSWAKTDEVVNNSMFGHTVGYLVNEVGQLKDYHGLTMCGNPHITGINCTESEKEEIKRLLEEGVILPESE